MSLKFERSRKKTSMENWRDYGGSLDRFDRNNWRRRGLYEDLSNAIVCGISQVCWICISATVYIFCCKNYSLAVWENCWLIYVSLLPYGKLQRWEIQHARRLWVLYKTGKLNLLADPLLSLALKQTNLPLLQRIGRLFDEMKVLRTKHNSNHHHKLFNKF